MPFLSRRLLRLSLLFVLGIGLAGFLMGGIQFPGIARDATPGGALPAPELVNSAQLVEEGLARYRSGKFLAAIDLWEKALARGLATSDQAVVYSNLGQAYRQIGKLDRAISVWEKAVQLTQNRPLVSEQRSTAQLLIEQAQAYIDLGQHNVAIDKLNQAIKLAQAISDPLTEAAANGALGNALWALGTYDNALAAHQKSFTLACQLQNPGYVATSLTNLGNVFVSRAERGRYQATAASLEGDGIAEAASLKQAESDTNKALAAYQNSVTVSRRVGGLAEVKALLNWNRLLAQAPVITPAIPGELTCPSLNLSPSPATQASLPDSSGTPSADQTSRQSLISQNRDRILALLNAEPDSQDKAYALINLANSLLAQRTGRTAENSFRGSGSPAVSPVTLLEQALLVARNVQDGRAESFALGTLGQLYEFDSDYDQAMQLTRQAQFVAQNVSAPDSLYRWQWQVGRLLKARGQQDQAIAAYEQAIATLQSIRSDIVVANKDLQFDFRDSVEPVYRQLIGLLLADDADAAQTSRVEPPALQLKAQTTGAKTAASTRNIRKVLDILELLKLAELQNFFGDECVQVARDAANAEQALPAQRDTEPTYGLIDPRAAVIYSVVLDDRSYMILRLPDGSLKKYPVFLSATASARAKQLDSPVPAGNSILQPAIDELRNLLEKRSTEEYLLVAQSTYDALIRPMEQDLEAAKPATLVFIQDGVLRKVPMTALHDGKQFLIEKYPIATTPSLSLTTRRPFDRNNLKALILGLTVEQAPFAALPNVAAEVEGVQKILGGTELVDRAFTLTSMQQRLEQTSYPIIHMATHGKFGADAASTFLLAYGDRITINELDEVLRNRPSRQPVELLTLSACQTAAGDNRSALGIAGVAVRAGVKSALATLWFINDQATVPLIEEFYTQLRQPNVTKAEALRSAQLKLIRDRDFNHPAVWSPFILIGNWL